MKNKVFGSVLIIGLIGFLYPLSQVIGDLNSWNEWDHPSTVSKLIRCLIFALIAMAGAMGINVSDLPFIKSFFPCPNVVSQDKINEINKAGV